MIYKCYVIGITTLLLGAICTAQDTDPCTLNPDHVTVVPHDPEKATRSANVTSRQDLLCDRGLTPGWYIFLAPSGGNDDVTKSLTMATRCVPNYHCGTQYTIWLDGQVPTPDEGTVNRRACVNVMGACCAFRVPTIKVKNCGNEIIAYYLQESPGCPSGYCFGDHAPCPTGEGSPTGFTPNCVPTQVPELNSNPVLELANRLDDTLTKIVYSCAIALPGEVDQRLKFEVKWLCGDERSSVTVQSDEAQGTNVNNKQTFSLKENNLKNSETSCFGKYLSCQVRAYYMKGAYSDTKKSNRLWVGIEIVGYTNKRIELNEGEDDYEIQLKVHTPYLGDNPLDLEVRVPRGAKGGAHCATGEPLPQLVYGGCSVSVSKDDWKHDRIVKARVKASLDNKIEAATDWGRGSVLRRLSFGTADVVFDHPIWSDYELPVIQIVVKDKDTKVAQCSSTNDPHMTSFDGVKYELQKEGYFVLYRHKTQPFEVHAHYRSCNSNGRGAPYCNCAVGIMAGNDVIMFDKCGRGVIDITAWGPDQTRLRMATRGSCRERRGTRILQENGGKRYVVCDHECK